VNVRPLKDSDIPVLRAMYEKSGFAYDFPDMRGQQIETIQVAVDENDQPVAAVAVERILQIYLFMGDAHPAAKLRVIRDLHHATSRALILNGYHDANAFLPPAIADRFGRRLMKTFGWVRNWPSFCRKF
jgi:hypothetical protein